MISNVNLSALLALMTGVSICFCWFVYKKLWEIGKQEKVYCICVFAFTVLYLVFGWIFGISQGIFANG